MDKSRSVRLLGVACDISRDDLEVYFKDESAGGGFPVDKIQYPYRENEALVQFHHKSVAEKVLKRNHRLKGQAILVSRPDIQVFARCEAVISDTFILALGGKDQLSSTLLELKKEVDITRDPPTGQTIVTDDLELLAEAQSHLHQQVNVVKELNGLDASRCLRLLGVPRGMTKEELKREFRNKGPRIDVKKVLLPLNGLPDQALVEFHTSEDTKTVLGDIEANNRDFNFVVTTLSIKVFSQCTALSSQAFAAAAGGKTDLHHLRRKVTSSLSTAERVFLDQPRTGHGGLQVRGSVAALQHTEQILMREVNNETCLIDKQGELTEKRPSLHDENKTGSKITQGRVKTHPPVLSDQKDNPATGTDYLTRLKPSREPRLEYDIERAEDTDHSENWDCRGYENDIEKVDD